METRLSLRLKQLRKSFGLSPSQVIKKLKSFDLDFCDQSVYKWESGKSTPSIKTLKALAKIYCCHISYLVEEEECKLVRLSPKEIFLLKIFRTDFLFRSIAVQIIRRFKIKSYNN